MDLIDKRNMREKIARSIIKRQNVNYISQEELDKQKAAEEAKKAREIYERLKANAVEKEAATLQEGFDAVKRQQSYNAATKSYSGEYGKEMPEDEVTQGQIEKILSEKEQEFRKTLEESLDKS